MTSLSVRGATVMRGKRMVVEDASFSAQAGAITAVLGEAGAGKTSLLAGIAGLIKLERGAIFRHGAEITGLAPRRRGVAFLPPGTVLPAGGTVQAALREAAGRDAAARADALATQLGLTPLLLRDPATLSHGEAFLALTAARLASGADILLVDEAAAGLDADAAAWLAATLRAHAQGGGTVLLATRAPEVALQADHLVLLAAGRVLQAGTPASLYAEPKSAICARLTGPANILSGHVREVRPGGYIWSAGIRFVQAAGADSVRPTLGTPVSVCLRPERIVLLTEGERADNELDATITDLRSAGALLHVKLRSEKLSLLAAVPSWAAGIYPAVGQRVRAGWAATASHAFAEQPNGVPGRAGTAAAPVPA